MMESINKNNEINRVADANEDVKVFTINPGTSMEYTLTEEELNQKLEDGDIGRCCNCDELFDMDLLEDTDEGDACSECLENDFTYCDYHGRYEHNNDDLMEVYSINHWGEYRSSGMFCRSARAGHCYYCCDCDTWIWEEDSALEGDFVNGYYVCGRCLHESYAYCSECCEWVSQDDYDYDNDCCYECSESLCRVRGYHDDPGIHFYDKMRSNQLEHHCIGFEDEIDHSREDHRRDSELCNAIDTYIDSYNEELYYEHDGSLDNGFEIISQPHGIKEWESFPIEKIFDLCKQYGYRSHNTRTCGLHFHLSRAIFGSTKKIQDNNIAKLVRFYELFYDEIVQFARRESGGLRWCRRYDEVDSEPIKQLVKEKGFHDRYRAVNLTNEDTVEIRIMRGTLNADTFRASLDFVYRTAMNSRKIAWKNTDKLSLWLKGLKPSTIEYIKRRNTFNSVFGLHPEYEEVE